MIRSLEGLAAAPLAVMLTVAAGLFVYGSTIPVHIDHELFRALRLNACDANGVAGAASSAFWGTAAAIVALYLTEATRSALLAPASSAREVE